MEIKLKVSGMTCGGCKAAVQRVLSAQDGVEHVEIDLPSGRALVTAGDGTAPQSLVTAVEGAGYEASVER
jgi:copper chaperone CopZ